jgi:hypothetical protein
MVAIEEKYRPATDGSRLANVSADQFKQDPTVGKLQIERFNDVYKYYDAEIVQERGRGHRYAICYTLSKRTRFTRRTYGPMARSYGADELFHEQTSFRLLLEEGNILDHDGDRVFAEPYYYSPPSTASETERNRAR